MIFQVQLDQWFEALLENPSGVRSLADLIAFNNNNADLEEPPQFADQSEYGLDFQHELASNANEVHLD